MLKWITLAAAAPTTSASASAGWASGICGRSGSAPSNWHYLILARLDAPYLTGAR